jgi:hypothetical protein
MAKPTRLFTDRRHGVDRRTAPRRHAVALMRPERRRVVDRRGGAERRSTLERRGRATRFPTGEAPAEHVRNALQLLAPLEPLDPVPVQERELFAAAVARLRRALQLLEKPYIR